MTSKANEQLDKTLNALKANRFEVKYAESGDVGLRLMLDMIPEDAVVGASDSITMRQLGLIKALEDRGTKVINPFVKELLAEHGKFALFQKTVRKTIGNDVYLCGINAVTMDGKLISIDRAGNRVAGMVFGAKKVIVVTGKNKIVKDVDEALYRIKNVIAPTLARRRERNTPCAITGKCADCKTAERLCNITVIIEKKPLLTDMTIVLVNEDLGVGWDPSWPSERIQKIMSKYEEVSWAYSTPASS